MNEIIVKAPGFSLKDFQDKKEQLSRAWKKRIKIILPSATAHDEIVIRYSNNLLKTFYPFDRSCIDYFQNQSEVLLVGNDGDSMVVEKLGQTCYHMLIAGSTRFGKSSLYRCMLLGLLIGSSSSVECHFVDFKAGIELGLFSEYSGSIIASRESHATALIEYLHAVMEERLRRYAQNNVVNIDDYRRLIGGVNTEKRIIFAVDEAADFISAIRQKWTTEHKNRKRGDPEKLSYEEMLISMARRSASTGISILLATQYPMADVVNSQLSNQLTTKICFPVNSAPASLVILNQAEAASLAKIRGRLLWNGLGDLCEIQGLFINREDAEMVLRRYVPPVPISEEFLSFLEQSPMPERQQMAQELRLEQRRRFPTPNRRVVIASQRPL